MDQTLNYYKLIRYSIDLRNVKLVSLHTKLTAGEDDNIILKLKRAVKLLSEDETVITLTVKLHFADDGPFDMELVLEGRCVATKKISEAELLEYSYEQATPLLLPYAREVVASTLSRMHLPIYNIPTMDVLRSLEENKTDPDQE